MTKNPKAPIGAIEPRSYAFCHPYRGFLQSVKSPTGGCHHRHFIYRPYRGFPFNSSCFASVGQDIVRGTKSTYRKVLSNQFFNSPAQRFDTKNFLPFAPVLRGEGGKNLFVVGTLISDSLNRLEQNICMGSTRRVLAQTLQEFVFWGQTIKSLGGFRDIGSLVWRRPNSQPLCLHRSFCS